jgi:hypothetical protein
VDHEGDLRVDGDRPVRVDQPPLPVAIGEPQAILHQRRLGVKKTDTLTAVNLSYTLF